MDTEEFTTQVNSLTSKSEALEMLEEIKITLSELGSCARILIDEHFNEKLDHSEAYGIFDFGTSSNPYDQTFEKLVDELLEEE